MKNYYKRTHNCASQHALTTPSRFASHPFNTLKGNLYSPILWSYGLTVFFLLLQGCNSKKNHTLNTKISEIVAVDSLFEPTGDAELDSMIRLTYNAPIDTNLVLLYEKIGDKFIFNNREKGKEYYLKLRDLSEKLNWDKGRWKFASLFSTPLAIEGLLDSALVILLPAMEDAKAKNDEGWVAELTSMAAQIYDFKQWFTTALDYHLEALAILEKMDEPLRLATLYVKMADCYRHLYLNEKAIEYGEKALAIAGEHLYVLNSLGVIYSTAHQYEKSKTYLLKALEKATKQNNLYYIQTLYLVLADFNMNAPNIKEAELYIKKYDELSEIYGNSYELSYLFLLGNLEELRGNFAKSEKYILQAIELATEQENNDFLRNSYSIMCELMVAQHKFRELEQYRDKQDLAEKAFANETKLMNTAEMETKYETEKKQLEIEKQQQIIKRQNMQRWFFASGLAVLAIFVVLLWYMFQLRNRRNHVLEEMNATKDKFFSIISHDLKSPTVAQREALKILLENVKVWDPAQLVYYCNGLVKSADGLVDLLYNLLNWAQLQTGRVLYKPVQFDIAAEMRDDANTLFNAMAQHKEIELITELPDTALITGDINMLKTVVRNLVDNAIKFTLPEGKVILSVTPKENEKFMISVSDTGIGMTDEQIRKLSGRDAINRVSTRGTANETGTGLGLIVCKELLKKHGSILHIESAEGTGSKFWFEI